MFAQVATGSASGVIARSVHESLLAMPAEHREAIELAYLGGLTADQIAETTGVTKDGTLALLDSGLARLAGTLGLNVPEVTCDESRPLLAAYALDALASDARGTVAAHIASCDVQALAPLHAATLSLGEIAPERAPLPDLAERVVRTATAAAAPSRPAG